MRQTSDYVRGGQGRTPQSVIDDATGFGLLAFLLLAALAVAAMVGGGAA